MAKSNKIDKNEELIAGYQEAECLWNVLPPSHRDINFRRMTFTTGCTASFLLGGVEWGWGWEAEPPTKFSKSEDLTGSKISIFTRSCWEREEVTFFSGGRGRGRGRGWGCEG